MSILLNIAKWIDKCNYHVGKSILWLVLLAVFISAYNAIIRKLYDFFPYEFFRSSNAFLEIQWYLYTAVFILGAGYTLLQRGHVKVDIIIGRFSRKTQVGIEIFGIVFFLFPFVISVVVEIWPTLHNAYIIKETSENAGGLLRWPVYALIPIGFSLLGLQGISELIKRIAFLRGMADDPGVADKPSPAKNFMDRLKKSQSSTPNLQ